MPAHNLNYRTLRFYQDGSKRKKAIPDTSGVPEYSIDTRTSTRYKKRDPRSCYSNVPMISTPTLLQCYVETAYHC